MSSNAGLSTVSELVKQTSLLNNQQFTAAKQGLEFAETAIKTTKLTFVSQQNKLDNSFHNSSLTKDDYDKRINQLKHQFELDCAPWQIYVKKLSHLIEQYSSQPDSQKTNKRIFEQSSSSKQKSPSSSVPKRSRITFSSSSSDSDVPEPIIIIPTTQKKCNSNKIKLDSSTNTDPLELSLRSSFPSTPNNIPFTAQTNHITQRIPLQHINEIAAKQIVLLHDEGQLVRWNDIIWRILTHFHVQDLGNLGIQRADQIPCVDNLIRTQNKINTYLDAYTYWSTMGTLNEIEIDLARIFYKTDYNELLIGPIEKQPKIEELFRLRSIRNEQIKKDFKSSDILKYLDQFMTKEYAWKTENELNLEHFLKFIAEQVHVKNIYQLGIRIKSVYLARNCIKAMQANQRKTMEIARTELNQTLNELAQKEVEKILKTINDKQRQVYASMNPIDIINDLIEICRDLCQSCSSFRKISHALQIITKDSMLKNIFQIALCHGNLTIPPPPPPDKPAPTTDRTISKKIYFNSSSDSDIEIEVTPKIKSSERVINYPNEKDILQEFKEQINSLKQITFNLLYRIEQRLCEKFQVKNFQELGQGTFMDYIQRNEQLLFPVNIKFELFSSKLHENNNNSITTIPYEDIEQFILQTLNKSTDQQNIEQMICYHFQIESFEQLGHGTFPTLFNSIKQKKKLHHTSIHYECLMLDEIPIIKYTTKPSIEDLEKQALHAINQCPLLGNLHTDIQWNLHFRSILGKLKLFLVQHSIPILEIDHVTFLKLSSNSTLDMFKESLYNYDSILTSGHLVSILVQHNSLQNAPLSLLSNIVHTFFLSISSDNQLYHFLARIFVRIPYLLLSSIIQRVFLEPLVKLEGSQMKVRETFWTIIDKQDSNMIIRFIQLGQQLGFSEWSLDNKKIHSSSIKIPREKQSLSIIPPIESSSIISKIEPVLSGNNPYDVIEQIRREKFGIGLNLSDEGQCLTNQLKSLVGRSLERLSKELYNTDMHFVLELIQNADDNQYNTKPTLIFVIDTNSINIYNNELGFQENNIQALCDIGKSTKGKHQYGYIGQKGIGFKSVFTVCDHPEIYSNGYQICFDAHNGSIGYILPNWLSTECKDNEYLSWTTRICLPLKSENEMQKHKSRSLTESFNDIHPSLLLFLNRLRSIIIDNRLTQSKHIYERFDIPGTSIVEIHCGQMIEKWFVIKKQLIIPDEIKTNLDNIIEVTEIALAFPLHEIKNNGEIKLIKQDVYAYLPLRTFGFTFIIQADFEVPSSRQDILSDSIWNQFLLNEIPSLFLGSLDLFHAEKSCLPIDPLRFFLYFLPNETSVYSNNLFTPVCRTILHSLRSRQFLPVINDTNLHMPNECVLIHDSTIKEILTPEILYNHLNLYYLKDDLYEHEKQLYELGVHRLGHNELIDVIKQMFTSEITFENKQILSKWFSCLYRCLNELSLIDEQTVLKHIQLLKIFPLKNRQEFISLNNINQTIFFPSNNIHLSKLIENDLLIIDEELWMNFEENSLERIQIQTLLERLGIQRLTHRIICEQHIYPIFENEQLWKEKTTEILIAYVMYIFDLWSKQKHYIDMSRLKSIIQLLTNKNVQQPTQTSIHFTPKYGNPYDLSKDFSTYNWILLSDEYIMNISSSSERKKLHQFFSELGVSDFIFPINNWTYEQFDSLINIQSISINKRLFTILQENWLITKETELFLKHLKDSIWIPTIHSSYSYNEKLDQVEINKICKLNQSNNIYIKTKQIQKLFEQHVTYVDVEIDSNSSFANDLGLIEHITLDDVISMLIHWCEKSIFYTSISHMQNIYNYIYQNMSRNELQDLINTKPIFFVPIDSSVDGKNIIRGRFVSLSEVCWSDSTNLFIKYSSSFKTNSRFIIEPYYTEQKAIFLDTFAISLNPTVEEYINLLVHIASLETTEETVQDAFSIFKILGKWCEQSNQFIEKQDLQNHRWVCLNDNPLISDNDDIAQLFTQINNLPLIDIPSSDILAFFHLCDIKSLSSSITIEHIIENSSDGTAVKNLLSPLIPYIQLYMKSHLINTKPIFFVPIDSSVDGKNIIRGRFVSLSEVCWSDSTNLFIKYSSSFKTNSRFIIEPYYTEQKTIFLDTFAISLNPTVEEYINLLVHIASLETTEETVQDAFSIFKVLGKWCEQSNQLIEKQDLQNKLSHKSIFPTRDHRWVCLDDNPLISDNDDIAQLFTQINNLPLIDILSSDILAFFHRCDIKSLSSSITIEHIIENSSDGTAVKNLLSPLIPYIQLYMKSRSEFSQAYQWTKSINLSSVLLNIQFNIVDYLQLIYRMKSNSSICIIQEEKSYYNENQMIFYVYREWIEYSKYYRDIFHSFARIFIPNHNNELTRSLGNFMNLLYNEEENNLEIFAKYQQFDLEFKDSDDIPWQISSTSTQIKCYEPKIDEDKVRTLLENVAQNQEQYNAYKQKKRQEFQKNLTEISTTSTEHQANSDASNNIISRFDNFRAGGLSSIVETPYENLEQLTKKFNIDDLTHQVLDNRDSTIGSDQVSLDKIGRWGEQWVKEYLHTKYLDKIQSNEIEIQWLNENFEQGKPYDFIIKNLETKRTIYIEVKSTLSYNRQLIPITFNELQYCCSLSDINQQFQIYRIYNTGQLNKVKLRIVENIEEKLRKHVLELFLLI
ncbi:unnamed protein product [Adineta steineri]|uniref:Protein NO VEIN C-terminal domain-containing protein n=1 Tax=Adineta steineri TaxID=433720 RepID=A0A814WH54_9BILA|nr:unnamed protein product [Adineta steineri]